MIIKMSGYNTWFWIICRMLDWTKLVDFPIIRNDNYTARMLTCSSFHPFTTGSQPWNLEIINVSLSFFCKFFHKSHRSFFCDGSYGSGFKNIFFAKYFSYIFMSIRLIFPGKVKIYIRLLISLKAQKCCKWNGKSVSIHKVSAPWTNLFIHINSTIIFCHITPLKCFAIRTYIVWI